jgi:hypothetical protein
VHRPFALLVHPQPAPPARLPGPAEGVRGVLPRRRPAPARAFHPPGADGGQQGQVALVQVEQGAIARRRLRRGVQRRQLGRGLRVALRVALARGRQAGAGPAPARGFEGAAPAGARAGQPQPAEQEGAQGRHRPAAARLARAVRRLAGWHVPALRRQPLLGRAPAARLIGHPGDPLRAVAVPPHAHHVRAAGVDLTRRRGSERSGAPGSPAHSAAPSAPARPRGPPPAGSPAAPPGAVHPPSPGVSSAYLLSS